MGAVTGQGLAGLIRENFGVRMTFIAMAALFFINTGITATEFAGIAAWAQIFHLSRYIVDPARDDRRVSCSCCGSSNKIVERVFVVFSLIYLSYIVSGIQAKPDWGAVAHGTFVPTFSAEAGFLVTVVGLIGTTISPYMQFFLQSAVVDKGSRAARPLRTCAPTSSSDRSWRIVHRRLHDHRERRNDPSRRDPQPQAAARHRHRASRRLRARARTAGRRLRGRSSSGSGILNAGLFTATVLPLRPRSSSAKRSGSKRRSTAAGARRRSSTGCSPAVSCSVPGSCCCCRPTSSSSSRSTRR